MEKDGTSIYFPVIFIECFLATLESHSEAALSVRRHHISHNILQSLASQIYCVTIPDYYISVCMYMCV